jgi:hypothetical protein
MDTTTDYIQTMPNKTQRKLIVGSEKLFQPNNLLNQFGIGHDVYLFSYNENLSLKANSKALFREISHLLIQDYGHIVFMGHSVDCNILYGLYDDKNVKFDAGVFVNYKHCDDVIPRHIHEHLELDEAKIYSFVTKGNKKRPVEYLTDHQYVNSVFGNTRSKRLAQEIYGCVVYGAYSQDYLTGEPTAFIK